MSPSLEEADLAQHPDVLAKVSADVHCTKPPAVDGTLSKAQHRGSVVPASEKGRHKAYVKTSRSSATHFNVYCCHTAAIAATATPANIGRETT